MGQQAKSSHKDIPSNVAGEATDRDVQNASLAKMTPMMVQYTEIKAANPDCLLFYRMGDFYELFFEDAVEASRALGITLTKRGKHLGEDVAMCGVPVHAADGYLQRLIRLGFRVAVCEQMEDPAEAKKRGAKSVVRRDVTRLVTPGTLTEESLLDAHENNYLTSLFRAPAETGEEAQSFALASIDISTGEFLVAVVSANDLPGELVRLHPSEIVVGDMLAGEELVRNAAEQAGSALTPLPRAYFDSQSGERELKAVLGVSQIEGLGEFSRGELAAIAGVLKYVEITQIGKRPSLRPPKKSGPQSVLVIDGATRINLELVRALSGGKQGSLLGAVDRTVTGPGARELASRLSSPLSDPKIICQRLDAVSFLLDRSALCEDVRKELKGAPDIARALSRICLDRGSPRDLGAIRDGFGIAGSIAGQFESDADIIVLPDELKSTVESLRKPPDAFRFRLSEALEEELPVLKRDGGFVRAGFREDLDEARVLRDEGRKIIAALQSKYAEQTGVKSLKVRHNNVLGYFVEVTAVHAKTVMEGPDKESFIHRQTLVNAMRFTTTELSETEGKIMRAADRALAIELEVFADLAKAAEELEAELAGVAEALAVLDHYGALSVLALEDGYVRPKVDDGLVFEVEGGRHPVVEQALQKAKNGPFIENDCRLGSDISSEPQARILVLTGPNMAGKSTYLRQNALIVILAQMGSFVPASSAHIGVVDRLFSRVGASDDLARGRSTFMVEMVEAANILNQATERSLVILDEIGRGTATFDGLSIAWAAVEYLHEANRCRALFATHYHELTALAQKLDYAANATIEVKDWKDEIVFLHKVVPGSADRSYGIQVAKLAGLPQQVIERASEVLHLLENSGDRTSPETLVEELPLFAAVRPKSLGSGSSEVSKAEQALAELNPDELSPKEALEALYKIKTLCCDK